MIEFSVRAFVHFTKREHRKNLLSASKAGFRIIFSISYSKWISSKIRTLTVRIVKLKSEQRIFEQLPNKNWANRISI